MTRSVALRTFALVSLVAATIRCTDSTGPRTLDNSMGVILSGLVPAAAASAPAESEAWLSTRAVYVSLPPGAVPAGVSATIMNHASGLAVTTAVADGGFDPVPIAASVGDTLAVDITTTQPSALLHVSLIVAARHPPRIVRTKPPSGGRDVPLNATMMVVFSEPVDPATLDTAALQLFRNTVRIPGSLRLAGGATLIAEFQPASLLAPTTAYRLIVSPQIRGV